MPPLSDNVIWKICDLNREALSLVNIPLFVIKQRCIKSYSCCWDRMLLVGEILISRKLHDILFLPSFLLTKTEEDYFDILRVISQSYSNYTTSYSEVSSHYIIIRALSILLAETVSIILILSPKFLHSLRN